MTRVAIVQSNYLPWKGYFDLIARSDVFVLLDTVQYTRRDWRNRNRVKTPEGLRWITVPVVKGPYASQRIDEVEVDGTAWVESHLDVLHRSYRRAPRFDAQWPWVEDTLRSGASTHGRLSTLNRFLLESVRDRLGITTPLVDAADLPCVEGRSERLLGICRALGASVYLSGPSARGYLDTEAFRRSGIDVEWMDYGGYPEYPQLHAPFEHGVTVLDGLFHLGDDAWTRMCPREVYA